MNNYFVRVLEARPNAHNTESIQAALKAQWPQIDWDVSASPEQDEGGHPIYIVTPQTGDVSIDTLGPLGPEGSIRFSYSGMRLEFF